MTTGDQQEGGATEGDHKGDVDDGVDVRALVEEVKTKGESSGDDAEAVGDDSEAVPDPLYSSYRRLLDQMAGVPELPMRAALVERVFDRFDTRQAVWCIDQIVRAALWGKQGAKEAVMATVWWLMDLRRDDEYEAIKGYYEEAHRSKRTSVLDLFREVPPHRALGAGQELPEVRLPKDKDEITLGERRAMAAGPNRRLLERLVMDPDPLVIRKLLNNPHLQLEDVLELASRRPTTPGILVEVATNRRWFRRYEARVAVARNPYADTGLGLKLLPTLGIKTLRRIKFSGDLHELIQESADRLVTLREEKTAPWRV